MTKRKSIETYFEAFRTQDIDLLQTLFDNELGVRSFLGDLVFSLSAIESLFNKYQLHTVTITEFIEQKDVVYINANVKYKYNLLDISEHIIGRFIFKDDLISRAYEAIEKVGYTRIMCTLTYDGSTYSGFQRQPGLLTVQGVLEKGLKFLTKEDITIYSSGRTDKGVHAINQTFHFDTLSKIKPIDFARVLGNYLPDSIYLKSSKFAHSTFHSRYDAYSKEYVYKINTGENNPIQRNYEWHVDGINIDILKKELKSIVGTHNFTSFTKTSEDKRMIRTILSVDIEEKGDFLIISIIGTGFLRYMVRYLVGTAVEISKGDIDETLLNFIYYKDSGKVLWKAPSCGLYLKKVTYFE